MYKKPLVAFLRLSIFLFSAAGLAFFCLPGKANLKERYNKSAQASSENAQFFSKEWSDLGDFGTGWQKSFYVDASGNIYSFSSPGARANFVGVLGKEYRRNDNACGMQRIFGAFSDNFVPQFDCASKVYTTTTVYEIDRVKGVAGCGLYKYTAGRWNYELSPLSSGNGSRGSVKRVELGVCNSIYNSRVEEVEGALVRANTCSENNEFNCAAKNYEKHLSRFPGDIDALEKLARSYYSVDDYSSAVIQYGKLIEARKDWPPYWWRRAQSKFWIGDYEGAAQDHSSYLNMVASGEYDDMDWSKDSLFFLANSMVGFGACESAIDTYTRAISMSGGMMPKGVTARSYLHRGIVNYKLGNVEVAKQDFDAAIDLDSSIGSSYGSEAILPGLNIKVECKVYGRRG